MQGVIFWLSKHVLFLLVVLLHLNIYYLLISGGLACTWNAGPMYSQFIKHPSQQSKQKISIATCYVKKSRAAGRRVGNLHVLGVEHLNPPKKTVHGFKATVRNLRAKHIPFSAQPWYPVWPQTRLLPSEFQFPPYQCHLSQRRVSVRLNLFTSMRYADTTHSLMSSEV